MKIALICLPHYLHTKRLILKQLAGTAHQYYVLEEAAGEGGFAGLTAPANVTFVPLAELDFALLTERIAALDIDKVISFSDRGLLLAARLREHFNAARTGVPGAAPMQGNSVQTETWVVDKGAMRQRLHDAGLSSIPFKVTSLDRLVEDGADRTMPFIVKPTRLTASLCVELIDLPGSLDRYVERCRANKVFKDPNLIIEQYMPGKEFSAEGMIVDGEVLFLGVTESHTSGVPFFVGNGHDFFARHPDAERIEAFVRDVLRCLRFQDCPFHIEAKYTDDGFEVVEVHSRYGGAMIMELVEHGTGVRTFAGYVERLCGAPRLPLKIADDIIFSQHLPCVGEGIVIDRVQLGLDLEQEERVISYSLDYLDGGVIEKDIVPVNRLGYITYAAGSLDEANAFRRLIDENLVVQTH